MCIHFVILKHGPLSSSNCYHWTDVACFEPSSCSYWILRNPFLSFFDARDGNIIHSHHYVQNYIFLVQYSVLLWTTAVLLCVCVKVTCLAFTEYKRKHLRRQRPDGLQMEQLKASHNNCLFLRQTYWRMSRNNASRLEYFTEVHRKQYN